ncbi:Endonuclease/exonuclease/phosphatase [Pilobolus umbonatus]|nr:Endonuclease/exonuclease/phosphatase [Pilobolus umbonatus]
MRPVYINANAIIEVRMRSSLTERVETFMEKMESRMAFLHNQSRQAKLKSLFSFIKNKLSQLFKLGKSKHMAPNMSHVHRQAPAGTLVLKDVFHLQDISASANQWIICCPKSVTILSGKGKDTPQEEKGFMCASLQSEEFRQKCWLGDKDGTLKLYNMKTDKIEAEYPNIHHGAIRFIMVHPGGMWTLDNKGYIVLWDQFRSSKYHITPNLTCAVHDQGNLWGSQGSTVYRGAEVNGYAFYCNEIATLDSINGPIRHIVPIPACSSICVIQNTVITLLNSKNNEVDSFLKVSKALITAAALVNNHFIWLGFKNGIMAIYDTRHTPWMAIKVWKGHKKAIVKIAVDDADQSNRVISADVSGDMVEWDGLLTDMCVKEEMSSRFTNFSDTTDANILICSWNVDGITPKKLTMDDKNNMLKWLQKDIKPDIIIVGLQGVVNSKSYIGTALSSIVSSTAKKHAKWIALLKDMVEKTYGKDGYTVVVTEHMVGLSNCILVKSSVAHRILNTTSNTVKTSKELFSSPSTIKGSISSRFTLDDSSFCFVNCQLTAGQNKIEKRNEDLQKILYETRFPSCPQINAFITGKNDGSRILDHETVFLSGDLNYCFNCNTQDTVKLLRNPFVKRKTVRKTLQKEDQLIEQMKTNPSVKCFSFMEQEIDFDPIFKYSPGITNFDIKLNPPAWCDRILYRGISLMSCNAYECHKVGAIGCKPICASFNVTVKKIDQHRKEETMEKIFSHSEDDSD